jgi:uncharacterized protein YjbJ (UPF0337 family)
MRNFFKTSKRGKTLWAQRKAVTVGLWMKHLVGTFQHKAGQLTGNRRMQARGAALQGKGRLQSSIGWARQKIQHALSHVRGAS